MDILNPLDNLGIYLNTELSPLVVFAALEVQVVLDFQGSVIYNAPRTPVNGRFEIDLNALISPYLSLPNYNFSFLLSLNEEGPSTDYIVQFKVNRAPYPYTIISEPTNNSLYFQRNIPDIYIEKGEIGDVIFELKKGATSILFEKYTFDVEGKIRIRNLYEVIEKYFSSDSEIEMPGTTNISGHLVLDFNYVITQGTQTHAVTFTVLKCDADLIYTADSWTATNFMTRAYLEKRTAKKRNEYLSFLLKNSYGVATIHYKVIYMLNGVRTEIIGTLGTIAQQTGNLNVVTFNASIYRVMTVAGLPNFTEIIQYDIWLTGTGLNTAVYTFMVDNQPYRNESSYVFVNCFGVLETFTATGLTETKKAMEYNLANIDNHYRKITQDFYAEKQCNSGYLSEIEMNWLDDFIKSFDVIKYSQDITQNEEITLISVDKTDTEANQLQAFIFNYRKANNLHLAFMNAAKNISEFTFDSTFE